MNIRKKMPTTYNVFSIDLILYFLASSEFYKDDKNLLDYNCPKKEDFIRKGIGKNPEMVNMLVLNTRSHWHIIIVH